MFKIKKALVSTNTKIYRTNKKEVWQNPESFRLSDFFNRL